MNNEIKVLTISQPFASLFIHREKIYETRPKPTSFKGTYLIHAAKSFSKKYRDLCNNDLFADALNNIGFESIESLPTGAIIGSCKFTDFYKMDSLAYPHDADFVNPNSQTEKEIAFGDWQDGRYAWRGDDFKVAKTPIPYSNGQGYYRNFQPHQIDNYEWALLLPPPPPKLPPCEWCKGWGHIPDANEPLNFKKRTYCPAGCKPKK